MMTGSLIKIVTHNGNAHADEFLAVCLALAVHGMVPVERTREPAPEDLANPQVMVFDIGQRYEPESSNFDHHHDTSLPSTLQLAAKALGLHETLSTQGWYSVIDYADCKGPQKVGEVFGIGKSDVIAFDNPIATALIAQFGRCEGAVPPEFLTQMKSIGEDIIRRNQRYADDYKKAPSLPIQEVDGVRYIVNDQNLGYALEDYACQHGVDVLVRSDDGRRSGKEGGWGFKRVLDSKHIDFTRLREHPDFVRKNSFVHGTGFMARTTNPDCDIADVISHAHKRVLRYDSTNASWQEKTMPREDGITRDFSR